MSGTPALRIFISYSHDNRGHADRVAALSARLRQDGIDCQIDQYYVRPPEGWPIWMAQQIDRADTVDQARSHFQSAVDTLRKAGRQDELPRGLLGRAESYRFTGERDAARRDLDEAMAVATRDLAGQMKLHMTDVHLARARPGRRPDGGRPRTPCRRGRADPTNRLPPPRRRTGRTARGGGSAKKSGSHRAGG